MRCRLVPVPTHVVLSGGSVTACGCRGCGCWEARVGVPVYHCCPVEVSLAPRVMPPVETCCEIHGWNNSGANTCALVGQCLLLQCKHSVMIQVLGSGPFSVWRPDSRVGLPGRGAFGCGLHTTTVEAQQVSTPVNIMLVSVYRPLPPCFKKDLD